MDTHNLRDRSRVNVLDVILQEAPVTRDRVIKRTSLSKATVSRVVEELRLDGFLADGSIREHAGRGRRSTYVDLADDLGYVVGIDLGAASSRMIASDLRGRHLASKKTVTPADLAVEEAVDWVVAELTSLTEEFEFGGRLAGVAIAVTGRVMGTQITRTTSAHHLAGTQFHILLQRKLDVPVHLDNDANMALLAEVTEGTASGMADVALLSVSTAFGAAIAVEGTILRGRSIALGEIGVLPAGPNGTRLDELLSVNGLMATAAERSIHLNTVEDLWENEPATPDTVGLVRDFTEALATASAVFTTTFDPEAIVYNGRLRPLVQKNLPQVEARLIDMLSTSPKLRVTPHDGYSVAKGALRAAILEARTSALVRVIDRREEIVS